jgi:hypothetical protein
MVFIHLGEHLAASSDLKCHKIVILRQANQTITIKSNFVLKYLPLYYVKLFEFYLRIDITSIDKAYDNSIY